jgi:hypothetical protein
MLPRDAIQEMVSRVDNRVDITSDNSGTYTYTLEPYEQNVFVTSSLGVATIYLPDVGEACGKTYAITAITGNTNAVTVTEKASGNSLDFPGNPSLNAAYDRVLFASDGRQWWIVTDQYS